MADRKISQLTELLAPDLADEFVVVDASVGVSSEKNKKLKFGTLFTVSYTHLTLPTTPYV